MRRVVCRKRSEFLCFVQRLLGTHPPAEAPVALEQFESQLVAQLARYVFLELHQPYLLTGTVGEEGVRICKQPNGALGLAQMMRQHGVTNEDVGKRILMAIA